MSCNSQRKWDLRSDSGCLENRGDAGRLQEEKMPSLQGMTFT
jgi:hypothetical protein